MFKIGRYIDGMKINGFEYLLNEKRNKILLFSTRKIALRYLKNSGYTFKNERDLTDRLGIFIMDKAMWGKGW